MSSAELMTSAWPLAFLFLVETLWLLERLGLAFFAAGLRGLAVRTPVLFVVVPALVAFAVLVVVFLAAVLVFVRVPALTRLLTGVLLDELFALALLVSFALALPAFA